MAFAMDIVKANIPGSTGDQVISLSLGGATPDAIIVIVNGANGDNANTNNNDATMSWGFSDMTNDRCIGWNSEDGRSSDTETYRRSQSKVVSLGHSVSNVHLAYAEATVSGAAADEVTLNWSSRANGRITIIAFSGLDNAACGNKNDYPTSDGTAHEIDLGFTPNCVFGGSVADNFNADTNNARPSIGFSCYNGTSLKQGGLGFGSSKNDIAGRIGSYFGSNANERWMPIIKNDPSFSGVLEMTSYSIVSGSGFTVTSRTAGGAGLQSGGGYCYLALEIPDDAVDLIEESMPSSSGSGKQFDFGFSGFFPQGVLGLFSAAPARDTFYDDTDSGNITGGHTLWAHDGTEGRTIASTDENDADPTESYNQCDDNLSIRDDTRTLLYDASFTDWIDGGMEMNFATANGSDHMALMLAFRGDAVPSGGGEGQLVDNNPLLGHNLIGGKLVA